MATSAIVGDVSFVLSYGAGCKVQEGAGASCVERENIAIAGDVFFKHNFNNEIYLLNRFRCCH